MEPCTLALPAGQCLRFVIASFLLLLHRETVIIIDRYTAAFVLPCLYISKAFVSNLTNKETGFLHVHSQHVIWPIAVVITRVWNEGSKWCLKCWFVQYTTHWLPGWTIQNSQHQNSPIGLKPFVTEHLELEPPPLSTPLRKHSGLIWFPCLFSSYSTEVLTFWVHSFTGKVWEIFTTLGSNLCLC